MPDTSDKRLEIAYDAAQKKLAMQDATLGNVRTRANTLLATAALFTSFSAGVGLLNTDPGKGAVLSPCAGAALLVVVILLGCCVFYVGWPAPKWHFVPSASIIMEKYRAGKTEDEIRTSAIAYRVWHRSGWRPVNPPQSGGCAAAPDDGGRGG